MEPEVIRFFNHIGLFYSMFVKMLIKKFPFTSTFLSDLRILNPSERVTYRDYPNAVVRLAKQLPQLHLCEVLEELKQKLLTSRWLIR